MIPLEDLLVGDVGIPVCQCHTLVIGSGAASLAAAERLAAASLDVVVATESLTGGTSFNTGSDKQTYYRLAVGDRGGDSAYEMAQALWNGGAVHGDIALAEAVGSSEAFYRLVSLGVPFPMNASGTFVGYKTDHDPKQRGTSIGPYTSKVMVEKLLAEVRRWDVPIVEGLHVVSLVVSGRRVCGALFVDEAQVDAPNRGLRLYLAEAVVFGVGGPGGLYGASVYPPIHRGAIGVAIEAGVSCVNLTESQFGLASIGFRWNVSGTYQQVIPRYVSVGPEGDEREFLNSSFPGPGARDSAVFLKGYQWPFDPKKVAAKGSSLVDLLVHRERMVLGRRVFMDFTRNPEGFDLSLLSPEARSYLERSGATQGTPLERLTKMNPIAVEHYARHGIDLSREKLEVAVCAQHNNGGLAADAWWESVDLDRFFPIGEVNGSHGVYRPGGAALNAGQVGALRAARRIVGAYSKGSLETQEWRQSASTEALRMLSLVNHALGTPGGQDLSAYQDQFRDRMDQFGGIIRPSEGAALAARQAKEQFQSFSQVSIAFPREIPRLLRCRQLALAHAAYLDAIASYIAAGGGSRGSVLVADERGEGLDPGLDAGWKSRPDKAELREKLQQTQYLKGSFTTSWVPRRPIPEADDWFENVWSAFLEGAIFPERRDA